MFLFKASGATYRRVVRQTVHAFPHSPAEVRGDEFVLLAKNREDCSQLEKQVQNVAKLLQVRNATGKELEQLFPNVNAADRWRYVVELYWLRPLVMPFNLAQVPGLNAQRYAPVQGFAKLDAEDELPLFDYLCKTNAPVVLDIAGNAERP
jgi:hypothetical protein